MEQLFNSIRTLGALWHISSQKIFFYDEGAWITFHFGLVCVAMLGLVVYYRSHIFHFDKVVFLSPHCLELMIKSHTAGVTLASMCVCVSLTSNRRTLRLLATAANNTLYIWSIMKANAIQLLLNFCCCFFFWKTQNLFAHLANKQTVTKQPTNNVYASCYKLLYYYINKHRRWLLNCSVCFVFRMAPPPTVLKMRDGKFEKLLLFYNYSDRICTIKNWCCNCYYYSGNFIIASPLI